MPHAPKRASIPFIAKALDLAVSTVSRALSGNSRISEAPRQRVWLEKVRKRGIPLVLFDRILAGSDVSAVVFDDYLGGYQSGRHLLDRGYRRIAHFGGPLHLNS